MPDEAQPTCGMYFGGTAAVATPESLSAVSLAILAILQVSHDTHMDQETTRLALKVLRSHAGASAPAVSNVHISNSSIDMNMKDPIDDDER